MFKASALIFLLLGLAGVVLAGKGLQLVSAASRMASDAMTTQAEVVRIDERKRLAHRDQTDYWQVFYTEVVRFTAWNGETVEARLPEKNAEESRAKPGDIIQIRYHPDRLTEVVPAAGNPWPMQGVMLIVLGAAAIAGSVFMAWRKGLF